MATTIKLQRIGNSLRATIPKEAADLLALKQGDELIVDVKDETVILKRKGSERVAKFYGALRAKRGEVRRWPSAQEIKRIWE